MRLSLPPPLEGIHEVLFYHSVQLFTIHFSFSINFYAFVLSVFTYNISMVLIFIPVVLWDLAILRGFPSTVYHT